MTPRTLTLRASDLMSKHGFGDGDVLDDFADELEDAGFPEYYENEVLQLLVERHLIPLLPPGCEVRRTESNHNPIRVLFEGVWDKALYERLTPITVSVTLEQIIEVAREVQKP